MAPTAKEIENFKERREALRELGSSPFSGLFSVANDKEKESLVQAVFDEEGVRLFQVEKDGTLNINNLDQSGLGVLEYLTASVKTLDLAVRSGADVNLRNKQGETPVILAAEYGFPDSVRYLMDEGADLKVQNNKGENVMHKLAAVFDSRSTDGKLASIKILHESKVLPELLAQKNDKGETPLDILAKRAMNGDSHAEDLLGTLVDMGVDVTVQNERGENLFHKLVHNYPAADDDSLSAQRTREGCEKVMVILEEKGKLNELLTQKNNEGKTPFESAKKRSGEVGDLMYRLKGITQEEIEEFKMKVESFTEAGISPITALANNEKGADFLAVILAQEGQGILQNEKTQYSIVDKIIWVLYKLIGQEYRAYDVNALDQEGQGTLHRLCSSETMLDLAVQSGADVNLRNRHGETVVMKAAEYGFGQSVRYLADHGADLKEQDVNGNNLMHKLVEEFKDRDKEGQLASIKILEEKGVLHELLNQQNNDGKTPLDIAKAQDTDISKELVAALERIKTPERTWVKKEESRSSHVAEAGIAR
jgi:ankyrin repeat protein